MTAVPQGVVADGVAEVKAYLRTVGDGEDGMIGRLVQSAIGIAEAFVGASLIRRTFEDVVPVCGGWRQLRVSPVTAIGGLTAMPVSGAPFVLPVEAYAIDIDADGVGWVRVLSGGGADRVAVAYAAGVAAAWAELATPMRQGVVLLAAHLFEDRGAATPPAAVSALWRPFRRLALARGVRVA